MAEASVFISFRTRGFADSHGKGREQWIAGSTLESSFEILRGISGWWQRCCASGVRGDVLGCYASGCCVSVDIRSLRASGRNLDRRCVRLFAVGCVEKPSPEGRCSMRKNYWMLCWGCVCRVPRRAWGICSSARGGGLRREGYAPLSLVYLTNQHGGITRPGRLEGSLNEAWDHRRHSSRRLGDVYDVFLIVCAVCPSGRC